MTASLTYNYAPDVGECVDEAFERCGVDPSTLVQRHTRSARRSFNLLFSEWATKGVNLFGVDEQTQTVTESDPSYDIAAGTLLIIDMIVRRDSIDTPVMPMSVDAYNAIPDKTSEGLPTRFFHDRAAGTFTLWNAPENSTDQIRYWRLRRAQDVVTAMETPDAAYYQLEALIAGLAAKLALKFSPDRLGTLKGEANEKFAELKTFMRQRGNTTFTM